MKNGLTMTAVFEAESANYGEGMGNITTLKKLNRGAGDGYTYISRQALRYSLIQQLEWNNTPVEASGSGDKTVVQFQPSASIADYPEIDFFGYMKTEKKKNAATRSAVCRLSNAISLEPYTSDLDFLTNMGLARRIDANNAIAQSEIHKSFYAYTIAIDLDRVGEDGDVSIPTAEKAQRTETLLRGFEFLYRDIKGRRENLAPQFVIGGLYERKNPYFENRIQLNKGNLNTQMLLDAAEPVLTESKVGYISGTFANDKEIIDSFHPVTVAEFFDWLTGQVRERFA